MQLGRQHARRHRRIDKLTQRSKGNQGNQGGKEGGAVLAVGGGAGLKAGVNQLAIPLSTTTNSTVSAVSTVSTNSTVDTVDDAESRALQQAQKEQRSGEWATFRLQRLLAGRKLAALLVSTGQRRVVDGLHEVNRLFKVVNRLFKGCVKLCCNVLWCVCV